MRRRPGPSCQFRPDYAGQDVDRACHGDRSGPHATAIPESNSNRDIDPDSKPDRHDQPGADTRSNANANANANGDSDAITYRHPNAGLT